MKFKTYQYDKHWTNTQASVGDPKSMEEAARAAQQLESILSSILVSENLVILTGLGTSLCIKDSAGNSIAPTMSDLWNLARLKYPDFEAILTKVNHPKEPSGGWKEDIETLLSRCQMSVELRDDAVIRAFIAKTEDLIVESCGFLRLLADGYGLPVHESFLRKIHDVRYAFSVPSFSPQIMISASRLPQERRVSLPSTASHIQRRSSSMGFISAMTLSIEKQNLRCRLTLQMLFSFFKLHGSVDWDRTVSGQVTRSSAPKKPVIIYPRSGKFESSYNQPYFEMMSRFQAALRLPNTGLLVVGFGFNDAHLVGPLTSALRSNASLRLIAVAPGYETSAPLFVERLEQLIKAGDRRLTILAAGFEELVATIPDLKALSEEEQHQAEHRCLSRERPAELPLRS